MSERHSQPPQGPPFATKPQILVAPNQSPREYPLREWAAGRLSGQVTDRDGLSLTPVLGPECLDEFPTGQTTADFVQKVHLGRLEEAVQRHGSSDHHRFLQQVKAQRLQWRESAADSLSAEDAAPLVALQLAVMECAFEATRIYAIEWARDCSPVTDWIRHYVQLKEDDYLRLEQSLGDAVKAIGSMHGDGDSDCRWYLLGLPSIGMRLASLRDSLGSTRKLHGTLVEWLTDLFWHTVVFDSPCYPRMDELALQVSLVGTAESSPIRRMEPTATIERGDVFGFRRAVTRSVRRGFHPHQIPDVRASFHGALANVLHAQFAEWRRINMTAESPFPFPIAVSTTFDLELERAMMLTEAPRQPFHVAFPVVHTMANSAWGSLRWLVGTFRVLSDGDGPASASLDWLLRRLTIPDGDGWRWLDDLARGPDMNGFDGPLILKINGSPLHELDWQVTQNAGLRFNNLNNFESLVFSKDQSRDEPEDLGKVYHAPVLAERDVLQIAHIDEWSYSARVADATVDQGLPNAIARELDNATRFWLIAGQRMDDWSARLQLFVHVGRAVVRNTDWVNALAVCRACDQDRARLFDGLGISRASGDFELLVGELRKIATNKWARAERRRS